MRSDDEIRAAVEHAKRHIRDDNRWAAFADDELQALAIREDVAADLGLAELSAEAKAELERRKTGAT